MDAYEKLSKLGEGTYAVIYKARRLADNKMTALKKIKLKQQRDGINFSAIREIQALKELEHPNIVKVGVKDDNV